MDLNTLEIKLDFAEEADVSLENMSILALESFLTVTSSLKNIAESVTDEITFSIRAGSACTLVNGSHNKIQAIYGKIEEAINGESEDENITYHVRAIQKEIQNSTFHYQFNYANISVDERLRTGKTVQKKRTKNSYDSQLIIISGNLQYIGGEEPNYRFSYGTRVTKRIECTISDAKILKDHLYETISCLVLKKMNSDHNVKPILRHFAQIPSDSIQRYRDFLKILKNGDLFVRLRSIYNFLDQSEDREGDFIILLKSYKFMFKDVNEYKTLLILSDNFRTNQIIQHYRTRLQNDFDEMMSTY